MKQENPFTVAAAATLLLAFFLPWVKVFLLSASGFSIVTDLSMSGSSRFLILIFPLTGLAMLLYTYLSSRKLAAVPILKLAPLAISLVLLYKLFTAGSITMEILSPADMLGVGAYLTLAASCLLAVTIIIPSSVKACPPRSVPRSPSVSTPPHSGLEDLEL